MGIHSILPVAICAALSFAASADTVKGRVVDADGRGVARVEVASFWYFGEAPPGYKAAMTDDAGAFEVEVYFDDGPAAIMALDADRARGGLLVIDPNAEPGDNTITLAPLVELSGDFFCEEVNTKPTWTHVGVFIMPGRVRLAVCMSHDATFSFKLPPGDYWFSASGTDVQSMRKNITLSADEPVVDMGTVNLEATIIARHYGKQPPPLNITEARGVEPNVTLADFKGKWLLIEFWGYW